jgi:hypothetical protein
MAKANIGGHLNAIAAVAMKSSLVTFRFSFHAPAVFSWLQENKCIKLTLKGITSFSSRFFALSTFSCPQ